MAVGLGPHLKKTQETIMSMNGEIEGRSDSTRAKKFLEGLPASTEVALSR